MFWEVNGILMQIMSMFGLNLILSNLQHYI